MLGFTKSVLSNRAPEKGEDMAMTLMLDATFLLLIFFMVTATVSVQNAIQSPVAKLEAPSQSLIEQTPESDQAVTVQVDEFSGYSMITQYWDQLVGNKQDLIVALNQASDKANSRESAKLSMEAYEGNTHGAIAIALKA